MAKKPTNSQYFDKLLDIRFSVSDKGGLLMSVEKQIKSKKKFFIVTPNPEILVSASSNQKLKNTLNSAEISLVDGVGVSLFLKSLYGVNIKRIQGRKFILDLLLLANKNKYKIFLLGSKNEIISASIKKIKRQYPSVNVRGVSGPILDKLGVPIDEDNGRENKRVINQINEFKPDILFIAFGSPKQEMWWNEYGSELSVYCAMVVGGSLDVYSGLLKPPPQVLEVLGFEWLWRLIQEPRRLPRILKALLLFPLLAIRRKLAL